MQKFYSNGKLLLSGEYLILDGATGLALPAVHGQEMMVDHPSDGQDLVWESIDQIGNTWFEAIFSIPDLKIISFKGKKTVAEKLLGILWQAKKMNPSFLENDHRIHVRTRLEFPEKWGLGSSSTLINNIAQWSRVNAFELLFNSFGGSGYDIACAQYDQAILYHLSEKLPRVDRVSFNPEFKDQLYFVHLNKKQVSSDSIKDYRKKKINAHLIEAISDISMQLLTCVHMDDFNDLLREHESIIGGILELEPVQARLFPDYFGQIKSLGAWGGDFILATGDESTPSYFYNKGFETVIRYDSMIKT